MSLAHGSNDGQKGIGLIMLILIGILPMHYALNPATQVPQVQHVREVAAEIESYFTQHPEVLAAVNNVNGMPTLTAAPQSSPAGGRPERFPGSPIDAGSVSKPSAETVQDDLVQLQNLLAGTSGLAALQPAQRWDIRNRIMRLDYALAHLLKVPHVSMAEAEKKRLNHARDELRGLTDYAPIWVVWAVAVSLGLGTMIGWQRIVKTIGEKIGKSHMSYAQGASAELVATFAIGMADFLHLPVSTTHVLSSGVAGTMAANRSGVQGSTIRNILLAWALTLPVTMSLSGGLFLLFRWMVT